MQKNNSYVYKSIVIKYSKPKNKIVPYENVYFSKIKRASRHKIIDIYSRYKSFPI